MATDANGNLDEFFDFARLEADNERQIFENIRSGGMSQGVTEAELDSTMDWQYSDLITPSALSALPSQDFSEQHDYMIQDQAWANPDISANVDSGLQYSAIPSINVDTVFSEQPGLWPIASPSPVDYPVSSLPLTATDAEVYHLPVESHYVSSRPTPQGLSRQRSTNQHLPASATRKGPSSRIPVEARQVLEDEFASNPYPCSWEIDIIAHQTNLEAKRVRNWFNNTRARKKTSDEAGNVKDVPADSNHTLASKLSAESLKSLSKEVDLGVEAPQPPLETYLASSYLEEAAELSDIQAAAESSSSSDHGVTSMGSSSGYRFGKPGSVITSLTSSDDSAPTTYTMSSGGSNNSSFGRDRRRGRRRTTWKSSPRVRPKINGVDDSGAPSKNLPFFCTFCPRAFKTKYEWIRHEDSVHALRTTWICCQAKQDPLRYCPFCGQTYPDEYHMASHKYQQCRNKPETQRTFYRRDHFVQHLHHVHFANVKHLSPRLGCQARMTNDEGQNYGCKDLAMKWRRFGAPMRPNDPMLHCGFCGSHLENWTARCEHVAEHLATGDVDRAIWWPERKEHHLENLYQRQSVGPFRCRYCQKVFENTEAMNNHTHCRVWSCRFLLTFDDVASENSGPPLCPQFPSPKAHHCHLCGAGHKLSHVEHAQQYHKYRQCKQDLYSSKDAFLQHLHKFHAASHPLLLQHNTVLEQHLSRNKGASFEPVDFEEMLQGCRVATPSASFVDPFIPQRLNKNNHTAQPGSHASSQTNVPIRKKTTQPDTTDQEFDKSSETEKQLDPPGPRFFRLNPLVPFLSSRIYYLRNARMADLFSDGRAVLQEVEQGHVASLIMASGLLGMAGVGAGVKMKKYESGVVAFELEED